ncbi:hypothetical protein [Schinkia azotoformans]|uniref:hypothetical protein n=1 Tax=Schinkia azotoformans TaxID=1454 RepID=UPI002DBEDE07|nr:hypothetical protein [Schinkia azotoformans]MEC1757352.1 hypothetical protein [Schinkia azotoformans]
MNTVTCEQVIMGTMKADVEFKPTFDNEQLSFLEADMRFSALSNIKEIDLKDNDGRVLGSLKVNFADFEWERYFDKDGF